MATWVVFSVLVVFSICFSCAQVIKFGRTASRAGAIAPWIIGQERAFSLWEEFVNAQGGINVGGVNHNVSIVSYNDASDPDLVRMFLSSAYDTTNSSPAILYERLVLYDNVSFLFGPFSGLYSKAAPVAVTYEIPFIHSYAWTSKLWYCLCLLLHQFDGIGCF
jgi:ABC-type branched-subunit amino acid transport system substrate-binding protein